MSKTFHYKGFKTKLHYSKPDKIYYGSLLAVDDSVSFHGNTTEEALKYFHESVDAYIELLNEVDPDRFYQD